MNDLQPATISRTRLMVGMLFIVAGMAMILWFQMNPGLKGDIYMTYEEVGGIDGRNIKKQFVLSEGGRSIPSPDATHNLSKSELQSIYEIALECPNEYYQHAKPISDGVTITLTFQISGKTYFVKFDQELNTSEVQMWKSMMEGMQKIVDFKS